jgi:osmotically-inducible protein OsmY
MVMFRKVLIGGVFLTIVGGALAGSKRSDAETLTRVGRKVADKVTGAMPDTATVAGPIAAVKTGEVLSIEERVRVRLRTDKALDGAKIVVLLDGKTIRLRGEVKGTEQTLRAVELAQTTTGVDKVVSELAVPEGR